MAQWQRSNRCDIVLPVSRHKDGCTCPWHGGGGFTKGYDPHRATWPRSNNYGGTKPKPLEQLLIVGIMLNGSKVKQRLIKEGLLQDLCVECGIGPEWNGKPITLELDHISGDRGDWRFENLRILCPNCHSQTPTFRAKNRKSQRIVV